MCSCQSKGWVWGCAAASANETHMYNSHTLVINAGRPFLACPYALHSVPVTWPNVCIAIAAAVGIAQLTKWFTWFVLVAFLTSAVFWVTRLNKVRWVWWPNMVCCTTMH